MHANIALTRKCVAGGKVRCFNHTDRESIGICKACGKGICSECAVDLGYALSCHGDHEKRVASNEALVIRATRVQDTAGRIKYAAPVFFGFMGVFFAAWGFIQHGSDKYLAVMGFGFLGFALVLLFANQRIYRRQKSDA